MCGCYNRKLSRKPNWAAKGHKKRCGHAPVKCVSSRKKKRFGGGRRYSVKERQDMNLSYLQSLPSNSLVVLDNDSTWRSVFVQLLERSLSPAHVQGLPISTQNIIFNMTHVSPKGVVQVHTQTISQQLKILYTQTLECSK